LVRLKHETRTTLSYQGLKKRAERLKLAPPGALTKTQFVELEEQLYGKPFRRLPWRAAGSVAGRVVAHKE
jgi:hypothetical protein